MHYTTIALSCYIMALLPTTLSGANEYEEKLMYEFYPVILTSQGREEKLFVTNVKLDELLRVMCSDTLSFVKDNGEKVALSDEDIANNPTIAKIYREKRRGNNLRPKVTKKEDIEDVNDKTRFLVFSMNRLTIFRKNPNQGEIKIDRITYRSPTGDKIQAVARKAMAKKPSEEEIQALLENVDLTSPPSSEDENKKTEEDQKYPLKDDLKDKDWKILWLSSHWKGMLLLGITLGGSLIYWVHTIPLPKSIAKTSPDKTIKEEKPMLHKREAPEARKNIQKKRKTIHRPLPPQKPSTLLGKRKP